MGRRHTGRKLAIMALYQADLRHVSVHDVVDLFIRQSSHHASTIEWALDLSLHTEEKLQAIDTVISEYAIGWKIERINPVDRNILRIAFYELLFTKLDAQIVLNEAIEIAKKYSTIESPKFINGILGQYIKDRPERVTSTPPLQS